MGADNESISSQEEPRAFRLAFSGSTPQSPHSIKRAELEFEAPPDISIVLEESPSAANSIPQSPIDKRCENSERSSTSEKSNDSSNSTTDLLPAPVQMVAATKEKCKDDGKRGLGLHPSFYITVWIALSGTLILFNKWILHTGGVHYPMLLTTWHLVFATVATRILAKTSTLLDGRHAIDMTWPLYFKTIVPIGVFFSLSLVTANEAYLYLSVAFIQMLKALTPVVVLIIGALIGETKTGREKALKACVIVSGVVIASYGEIHFVLIGFALQAIAIVVEATRLVLVQKLLSAYKLDPLCSLYYFAPTCAVFNACACLLFEGPYIEMAVIKRVSWAMYLLNALVAFGLNVAVVFLIGKTSSLVMCLSGVLKDILLVTASVIIFSTSLTPLQPIGYLIALLGLIWYNQPAAFKIDLKNKENRGKAFTSIAGFTVLALMFAAGMFISLKTDTGVIHEARSLEARSVSATPRKLDIVVSHYSENLTTVHEALEKIRNIPEIKSREPRIIIYSKNPEIDVKEIKATTKADEVYKLKNLGRESATYMQHIIEHYDNPADHTLFVQATPHKLYEWPSQLQKFKPKTGFMTLGTCDVLDCTTPMWPRIGQIFTMVNQTLCPTRVSVSYTAQFIVSKARILANPLSVYKHLNDLLTAPKGHFIYDDRVLPFYTKEMNKPDNPQFGHSVERSYHILFNCWNPEKYTSRCSCDDPDNAVKAKRKALAYLL